MGKYDHSTLHYAKCSSQVKDLIRKMLVTETSKRITIESCLEHNWFKQFERDKRKSLIVDEEIVKSLKLFQNQIGEMLQNIRKIKDGRRR